MISLENVSFAYEHGPYLLQDVTMTVQDGDYISVVGENGSGKSTLIKLILGLLSPSRGTISNTFRRCAYVPQRFETLNSQFPITVYEVLNCQRRILGYKDKDIIRRSLEQMNVYDLKDQLIGCQAANARRCSLPGPSWASLICSFLTSRRRASTSRARWSCIPLSAI